MIRFNPDTRDTLREACTHAWALARTLLETLQEKPPKRADAFAQERIKRLRDAELPALMLFAGVLVRVNDAQAQAALEGVYERPDRIAPGALLRMLEEDDTPPVLAHTIVEHYVRRHDLISSRAYYNVACFYGNVGADLVERDTDAVRACRTRALLELDLALADASLVPWAEVDPSLRRLRVERTAEWDRLIARHGASNAPPAAEETGALDPMLASLLAYVTGFGEETSVRQGTDTDFEVVTPQGIVLVDVKTSGVAGAAEVQRLARVIERPSRFTEQPFRAILLVTPDVLVLREAAELARRGAVDIVSLALPASG